MNPNDLGTIKKSLRQRGFFERLDDETFEAFIAGLRWRNYRPHTEVFHHMDESDEVYVIASGRVRVTIYTFSGKEISYQELGVGDMFGELSAMDRQRRTTSVITPDASRLGMMTGAQFRALVREYPVLAHALILRLAGLVRFLSGRIFEYGALDVKERIRAEVLRLARANRSGDDTALIRDFPTHAEIANRVNTHREAVTRELGNLARNGIVERSGRSLEVRGISRLEDLLPEEL